MRALVCVLPLLLGPLLVQPSSAVPCPSTPAAVQKVAPGVFVRRGVHALMQRDNFGGTANIGFIVGREAVAVVDTGGSLCDGKRLRAAILSRTSKPIRYVINTHVHPDHIFGNAAFEVDKPTFVGHANLPRAMASKGPHYLTANRRIMGADTLLGTRIVPPTRTVAEQAIIDLGDRRVVLTAFRTAHTDQDLVAFDERTGVLFAGDLVFVDHVPVIDGRLTGWLKVIARLQGMRRVLRIVPGHGPALVEPAAALARQRRYLEILARDLRLSIQHGEEITAAVRKAARGERGRWLLFDEFNSRNATAAYVELEWE